MQLGSKAAEKGSPQWKISKFEQKEAKVVGLDMLSLRRRATKKQVAKPAPLTRVPGYDAVPAGKESGAG